MILYDGKIFCVNLGDCRAVLSRSRSATGPATNSFPLSKVPVILRYLFVVFILLPSLSHHSVILVLSSSFQDHRPGRERQRIMDAGGWISDDGRINGVLMCSRAFGDREFKYEEDKEGGLKFLATMREVTFLPKVVHCVHFCHLSCLLTHFPHSSPSTFSSSLLPFEPNYFSTSLFHSLEAETWSSS